MSYQKRLYDKAKRANYSNTYHDNVVIASRAYIKALKIAKAKFLRKKRNELKQTKDNPKEYWKILDFKKKMSKNEASLNDLSDHFEKLNIKHENDELPEQDFLYTLILDDNEELDQTFSEEGRRY